MVGQVFSRVKEIVMKNLSFSLRLTIAAIILLTMVSSCTFPPKPVQYTEFYVSVKGSDTTGNGTKSNPWRHIQYAIDKASAKSGTTLRINVLKGIYEEELVIHKPLLIKGAGVGKATTWVNDPLYPQEEVSIITVTKFDKNPNVFIENATSVNLQNLVIQFGGVRAVNTRFIMYNVEIPDSRGLFAVQIENCSLFYIEKTQIRTYLNTRSDYGIDIMSSDGDILETYIGNNFDHAININPFVLGDKPASPFLALKMKFVKIRDSEIAGARISYADGIRITGPTNVQITNTKITRTHPDNQSGAKEQYNRPHAGISIGGWLTEAQGHALIEIDGVTISGFDTAIGVAAEGFDVKVQNSSISSVTHGGETFYTAYTNVSEPIVDFGGGPLGSIGKNNFANTNPYAFYNDAPYDVYACFNKWNVSVTEIDPMRIFDKLDVATKGRVRWNCSTDLILITPSRVPTSTADRQSRATFTPTLSGQVVRVTKDAICFVGPGESYGVVSTITKDQQVQLLGMGQGGDYYVITNPRYLVPCWVQTSSIKFDGTPGELRTIPIPTITPIPPNQPEELPDPTDTSRPPGMVP